MCHCDPHKRTPCCGPECCGIPGGCAFCKPKPEKPRAWFLTMSGQQFFYDEPEAYKFSVEEIAHVLGNLCRFNGNLTRFYSVAEHSVHVLATVRAIVSNPEPDFLRYAVMHDASESVLLDIPRPMKRLPWMAEYLALEARVEHAIAKQLGFFESTVMVGTDPVKVADAMVLRAEKDQLRGSHGYQSRDAKVEPANVTILCLEPEAATALFLEAWRGIS